MMLPPEQLEEEHQRLAAARAGRAVRRHRILVFVVVVLAAISLGVGVAYVQIRQGLKHNEEFLDSLIHLVPERRRVNVLLVGADTREEDTGRSDTLMLVSFDPLSGSVGVMSIPRDTRVHIPGRRGYDKVNAAFAIGGAELAKQTVAEALDVRIDYFVVLDFSTFEKIVDTLGGVMVDVPKRMYYVDRAQGLIIDLRPGLQRLDGRRALGYVRFRHDAMGDISLVDAASGQCDGRVERQLQFVRALARQAMRPMSLFRIPQLLRHAFTAIDTDIPVGRMVSLTLAARRVRANSFHTYILPGVGQTLRGVSYWVPDMEKAQQAVDEMVSAGEMRPVRIAVLNGSGVGGAAGEAAEKLRQEGYDVVFVGNAERFDQERTHVVALSGDVTAAGVVAKALGVKTAKKRNDTHVSDADVAVVVGRDSASVFAESEHEKGGRHTEIRR
jgi:LCP family protein required for cell wall assembly